MKKFLLVIFIGMVLAINIYGFAMDIMSQIEQEKAESEVATVVYME